MYHACECVWMRWTFTIVAIVIVFFLPRNITLRRSQHLHYFSFVLNIIVFDLFLRAREREQEQNHALAVATETYTLVSEQELMLFYVETERNDA